MSFPRRDWIATLFVAAALAAYAAWLVLADHPGASSIRVMAGVVLAFGVAASATAVVPGFDELLHSSKIYLAAEMRDSLHSAEMRKKTAYITIA